HPVLLDLASTYDRTLKLPAETQSGEVYIDTIAVSPGYQGGGIGKMILLYAVDLFVKRNQQVLGLLVNLDNPLAKKLYLNVGFTIVNRVHIFGAEMEHLQYRIGSRITNSSSAATMSTVLSHASRPGPFLEPDIIAK